MPSSLDPLMKAWSILLIAALLCGLVIAAPPQGLSLRSTAMVATATPAGPATDPSYSSIAALFHFNGSDGSTTFTDNGPNSASATAQGNAQLDTAQAKFGTASLLLDGTGDCLSIADASTLDLGAGDWTIEGWVRFNSLSGFQTFYEHGYVASGGIAIQTGSSNGLFVVYISGSAVVTETSSSPSTGQWYFYQFVRSGGTITIYRDGVSAGSASNSTTLSSTDAAGLGGRASLADNTVNGWMDDVRITKGVARSAGVPSAQFPDS